MTTTHDVGQLLRRLVAAVPASVEFLGKRFSGRAAIEQWHRDRFAAQLRFLELRAIRARGQSVQVNTSIWSTQLAQWRLSSMPVKSTVELERGKIKNISFGLGKR